jgi:chromosome segregation ATPase
MKFLYFQNKNEETLREKFNKMTNDITIFQNNEENFNNKILYLEKENQKIKEEKNFIEKNFEDSEINNKNIIFNLQNSYSIILNDYQKLSEIFDKKQKELSDISSEKINIQKDLKNYQNNFITIQKENINLKSENDGYKKRLNTYEYEVDSLKKEIKNLEEIIKQNRFSNRIFKVNYIYMGMTLTAIIILEKEKNNKYVFKIENRTSTRKFNLLDLEINQIDNNKIVIKFLKDNTQE